MNSKALAPDASFLKSSVVTERDSTNRAFPLKQGQRTHKM